MALGLHSADALSTRKHLNQFGTDNKNKPVKTKWHLAYRNMVLCCNHTIVTFVIIIIDNLPTCADMFGTITCYLLFVLYVIKRYC